MTAYFTCKGMTAQSLTGTNVTITDFDVIIEDGKPIVMFFVKTEDGHHAVFNQNDLTNYVEVF